MHRGSSATRITEDLYQLVRHQVHADSAEMAMASLSGSVVHDRRHLYMLFAASGWPAKQDHPAYIPRRGPSHVPSVRAKAL